MMDAAGPEIEGHRSPVPLSPRPSVAGFPAILWPQPRFNSQLTVPNHVDSDTVRSAPGNVPQT